MTPQHLNPLCLTWSRMELEFCDYAVAEEQHPPSGPSTLQAEYIQPVCLLDKSSLIRLLLLLSVVAPPNRRGIIYDYRFTASYLIQPGQPLCETGSPALDRLYGYTNGPFGDPKEYPQILEDVKQEWQERLALMNIAVDV